MARVSLAVVFVIIGVVNAMGVLAAVAVQEEGVAVLRAAYATTRHPVSPRMGRRRWVREDGSVRHEGLRRSESGAISGSPKYKQLRQEVTNEFSSNAVISRDISGSPKYKQLRQEVTNEFDSIAVTKACRDVNQELFRAPRNTSSYVRKSESRAISGSPKYRQL
ncbi:hypothetical protein HBI42_219100 [Parastagonospora nodorum]|nr:hypothetical protein HBI47_219350 [Parastagonospora nodorum]KAH6201722.1 hypothetical protein HBI43_216650 [Parastagonospora nodorum]KAH6243388.1 hypothetical protein HBI42_219100 [Parastagonospora nodorum]